MSREVRRVPKDWQHPKRDTGRYKALPIAGTGAFRWLKANAPRFGWVHPAWAEPGGALPMLATVHICACKATVLIETILAAYYIVTFLFVVASFVFNALEGAGTIVWATTKGRLVPPRPVRPTSASSCSDWSPATRWATSASCSRAAACRQGRRSSRPSGS